MLAARLGLYLLLPHALGTASTLPGQVALCLVLFFVLIVESNTRALGTDITLLQFALIPLAVVALLSGREETEVWTLHLAAVLLPMALTKTD